VATVSEAEAADLAREALYRFLAAALADPQAGNWERLLQADSRRSACAAAGLLREEAAGVPVPLALGELPPAALTLEPLCAWLEGPENRLCEEYQRVFGLIAARECPPYETEYQPNTEPFFRTQQMADVAGFYRAFGLGHARSAADRPDHAALELEFMAYLLTKKRLARAGADGDPEAAARAEVCDDAARSFFRDHLAWWLPAFAAGLRRRAGGGFFAELGRVLAAFVPSERRRLGVDTPSLPGPPQPREAPEEPAGCAGCSAAG
jgi:TorA maturation chaperone TorD